jgi:hypothetical protein
MAIKLSSHKGEIDVDMNIDVDGDLPVIVTITGKSLTVRVKGQRIRQVTANWAYLLSKMQLPGSAPGKYLGRSLEFMKGT